MGSAQARYTHRNFEGEQLGVEAGWAGAGDGQQFSVGGFWDIPWLNNDGLGLTLSSGFTHHNHYGDNISAAAQFHIPLGGPHSHWLFSPGLRTSLLLDNNQTPSLRLQPSAGFQYDYPGRTKLSLQGGPTIDSSGRVFFEAMTEGIHKFFLSKNQKLHLDISGNAVSGNAGVKVGNVPEQDLFRSALVLQDYGGPISDLNLAHAGTQLNLVLDIIFSL